MNSIKLLIAAVGVIASLAILPSVISFVPSIAQPYNQTDNQTAMMLAGNATNATGTLNMTNSTDGKISCRGC